MSFEQTPAEELEIWRSQETTEALVKALRVRRAQMLEQMAGAARSSRPESEMRVAAGRVAGLDEALEIINTKGKTER